MNKLEIVTNSIKESISTKTVLLSDDKVHQLVIATADMMVQAFKNKGKVLFCGNGGSAADAQHLAAELSGRFKFDRDPLDSDALHCNTSYLTAVANDYSYEQIFSRLVKAKINENDVLVGLSTSGNSKNVLEAFKTARGLRAKTVLLSGECVGKIELEANPDVVIRVPSTDTARIQESHIMLGHIICDLVERSLFEKGI